MSPPIRTNSILALLFSLVLLVAVGPNGETRATDWDAQYVAAATLINAPAMTMPGYRQTVMDPVFQTRLTRITEPGRLLKRGMTCGADYCRHRYSSTQAWNSDQSLLVITKGCADLCFFDGHTFEPLFSRLVAPDYDCKWHPVAADRMICVHARGIDMWSPRTNAWTHVFASKRYSFLEFGPYKGNPSRDGRLVAVRAKRDDGALVAFAVDLRHGTKNVDIDLSRLAADNQYVTISPSGRYIYVAQLMADGREPAYVFTAEAAQLQHWQDHHRPGHGDLTIDDDGNDVYVGISKSDPDKYHVIKRRLKDGVVTSLIPYGNASHVSARNIDAPGWVLVTFQGNYLNTAARKYPAPFYRELVALRIDGSGEILRLGHTRSALDDYLSESHGSPSPDASMYIWSSNWGNAGGPVSDYVTAIDTHRLVATRRGP
jgi:hypothetical protein